MSAPVPGTWRAERTYSTSPTTMKYNLNSCVIAYVLNPQWQNEVDIPHAAFCRFFERWSFIDCADPSGEYVKMIERTSPLTALQFVKGGDTRGPATPQVAPNAIALERRLLSLRLTVEDLELFRCVVRCMAAGIILNPVPFRGVFDARHQLPDEAGLETLVKTDDQGETWTYLF